jgi:hypothetical protein
LIEHPERDAAPSNHLPYARAVPPFKVFDGGGQVCPLPAPREEERADEDRESRRPEHRHAHKAVLVPDLRVCDEDKAADHRHIGADRAHPPRDLLAAGEKVARVLDFPPHDKPNADKQHGVGAENRNIKRRQLDIHVHGRSIPKFTTASIPLKIRIASH